MAETQSYATHTHQPKLFITGSVFWLVAVIAMVLSWFGLGTIPVAQIAGLAALGVALLIGRAYIVALQDRIIKLEMKVRAATVLTPDYQKKLQTLSKRQLIAIRFASDGELPALIDRALNESLAPDEIKKAVRSWQPDLDRT